MANRLSTNNLYPPTQDICSIDNFIERRSSVFFILGGYKMLLHEFYDTLYPYTGFTSIRKTTRAIVLNEHNEVAMMHIKGNDIFGPRDHYETPGGGVEGSETLVEAIKREILEEVGYECEIESYLGSVINRYNLLEVITMHHFFVVRITKKASTAWTDAEKEWFDGVVWKTPESWREILNEPREMVNELVHDRERFIIDYYLNQLNK